MSDWRPPDVLPDLRRIGLLAIDTETDDHRLRAGLGSGWPFAEGCIVGVSVAYRDGREMRAHYFPIRHPDTNNFAPAQVFQWLRDHIAADVRFVTQNGLYDWGWLRADGNIAMPPSERLEEIGALATLVDENRRSYSLDNLCAWRGLPGKDEAGLREAIEAQLGIKPGKRKNPPQAYIAQLPARFVGPYAEGDGIGTLALFENLNPILDQEGTRAAYRTEVDLLPMVQEMRWRGIRVDVSAAERGRVILLQKRDAVFAELAEKLGRPVDMEDINHVPWLAKICDQLGVKYPRTPTGQPSFKAGPSGWLHRHPHWFPQLVHRARSYNKAAVDFLQLHVLDHAVNGRIHPEIHPHRSEDNGTKSFRFSYSNPPLQQMPSHDAEITALVRRVFLPEEGERWATTDASQQEFRLIVHRAAALGLSGAGEAAGRFHSDRNADFHSLVAEMTGLDRQIAKSANFAKAYGAGVGKFATTIGKPESEAQTIYEHYDRTLPFVRELSMACQRQLERQGFLQLYDGARRHFDEWAPRFIAWGSGTTAPCAVEEARRRVRDSAHPWFGQRLQRVGAYAAMNALIQGDAARHTKLWMRACWREGIVPLLQMHDGLELSVAAPEQAEHVTQLGRDAVSLLVPMQVEVKFGRDWADATHSWAEVPKSVPEPGPAVSYQPPPPVLATQLASLVAPRVQDFVLLDQFVTFVAERHAIYLKRQAGLPPPWTSDPILSRWSFCNMYRDLDKTSAWIWENWILPHADDPYLGFAMLEARLINRIDTLKALGYPVPWVPEQFIEAMRSLPEGKRYGSAYVVPAFRGDTRPKYVSQAERIFTPIWNDWERLRPRPGTLVAEFARGLQAYSGLGDGFLVAQVAADTKRAGPLKSAPDVETFALSGPGSRIGMNYLLGRKRDATWRKNDRDWYPRLVELRAIIAPIYQDKGLPVPTCADLQNQLCEAHKNWDISSGFKERLKREYKFKGEKPPRAKRPKKEKAKPARERSEAATSLAAMAVASPPEQKPAAASAPTSTALAALPVSEAVAKPNGPATEAIPDYILNEGAEPRAAAPSQSACLAAALAYAARGWIVFPVPPGTKKSYKSAEHSNGRRWGATADADEIRRDYARWPQANIGIPCGAENRIWVLEADTKEGGHEHDGIASLRALEAQHGVLPPTLQARSPSGSLHHYFKWPADKTIRNSASKIALGVDVRGEGGMVLAPPSVKPGGGAYSWIISDAEIADAPGWLVDLAVAASSDVGGDERAPNPDLEAPLPLVKAAVAAIPNSDLDWESWNKVGMAIFGATGGSNDGFILFDEFSKKSAKYDSGKTFDKWRLFHTSPPKEIGFGSLHHWASKADPDWGSDAEAEQSSAGATGASDSAKAETHAGTNGSSAGATAAGPELEEWDAGELLSGPPPAPRQWLTAYYFCRSFLSGLVAPGDAGKTTLRLTQAIELASGRELLGQRVHHRARVLVLCFEDDRDELHRRLKAICKHYSIDAKELKGWLFCRNLKKIKLAELDAKGRQRQVGALDGMLRRAIERGRYDLVILDPFVKLHALMENDNAAMDFVCELLIDIAQSYNIAVDSPAHTHKGAITAGDADARRGASAQRDAGRLDYTLTVMSEAEAEQFEIDADARKSYVRLDKAKANIVRAMKAAWFRLVSVPLGNATALYPDGDAVQAIECWTPPETWADMEPATLNAILNDLDAGMENGQRYSKQSRVATRAAWHVVRKHAASKSEAQCREIIKQWCEKRVLVEASYDDPVSRKPRLGLHVDGSRRPQY